MQEVQLMISGKRPIAFIGEELEHFSDKEPGSRRWTVVRVFRLKDGGYVVGVAKLTNYLGERDKYDAKKLKTLERVEQHIKELDPGLYELMAMEEKIGPESRLDPKQENQKQRKEEKVNEKES